MGTLTANVPELPEHCVHKLPTSCRLTATPTCCACQDHRPHSLAYPTYVDGVGLVSRGTRWQRYCWFCKEFWANRVAAVQPPLDPRDTRIPDEPDQKDFLDQWFDFYRGYKVELDAEDGSERRVTVHCEKPWRDVPPGELPLLNEQDRVVISQRQIQETNHRLEQISLDNTLDELLAEAEADSDHSRNDSATVARDRIPMQAADAQDLLDRLRRANARLAEAETRRRELSRDLATAQQDVRAAREERSVLTRESQMARFARVFGTREEMQAADYVSPLTSMFSRAYDRYRVAEEVRNEARIWQLSEQQQRMLWTRDMTAQDLARFEPAGPNSSRLQEAAANRNDSTSSDFWQRTLDDEHSARPPPQTEEQMTIRLDCKICLQQMADTAVLPCGHLVMCQHCAAIAIPCKRDDALQPAVRNAQCPMCRKQVRRLARIHTA